MEKSAEKHRFIQNKVNVKVNMKINDLLKNDKNQLVYLAELIIFISAISSKSDYFLDLIGECEEKIINYYCSINDKFLINNGKGDESLLNTSVYKNYEKNTQIEKIQKKNDELEMEKQKLLKNFEILEKDNQNLKEKLSDKDRLYNDIEYKYRDSLREVELLKNSNKSNFIAQEELLQESLNVNKIKAQLQQKDIEMEDIRRDNELIVKSLKEEISKLKEKMEIYEDKVSHNKAISNENEKLKAKIKELNLLKEKQIEYDDVVLNLESKTRMIDTLMKEKQNFVTQIEKLNNDVLAERQKSRQTEFERKKIESEVNDLRKDQSRLETQLRNKEILVQNYNTFSEMKRNSVNNSEIYNENKNLFELDESSVFFEVEKNKDEQMKILERENDELRFEKSELMKKYNNQIEEINKLNNEKEKLVVKIEDLNMKLNSNVQEKNNFVFEKEKMEIKFQKLELEQQKKEMLMDQEKKKIEDELKDCQEKLKKIAKDKETFQKEKENLSKEIEKINKKTNEDLQKISKEKQALVSDHQKEIEKIKLANDKESKYIF